MPCRVRPDPLTRDSVWARGGRFMARRTGSLMCCSGMSMYLQTCGSMVDEGHHLKRHEANRNRRVAAKHTY
jgi:hypothetical protein